MIGCPVTVPTLYAVMNAAPADTRVLASKRCPTAARPRVYTVLKTPPARNTMTQRAGVAPQQYMELMSPTEMPAVATSRRRRSTLSAIHPIG
jgi:hypothetical protein